MGLEGLRAHRAASWLIPKDSNTVYACATGHLWDDNDERGVYKTTDGGKTWKKVLAGANGSTGCAMLSTNRAGAQNDLRVHVGFPPPRMDIPLRRAGQRAFQIHRWRRPLDRNRRPATARDCRKNHMAGSRWQLRLPSHNVVYAMIESKQSALFRSDDGGQKLERNRRQPITWCGGRFTLPT